MSLPFALLLARRKMAIKKRKMARSLKRQHDFNIWVHVKHISDPFCGWLGLRIPLSLVYNLQAKYKDTDFRYLLHQDLHPSHNSTIDPKPKGPFYSDLPRDCQSAILGSEVCCVGGDFANIPNFDQVLDDMRGLPAKSKPKSSVSLNPTSLCHIPRCCKFGSKMNSPRWTMCPPLSSPRYMPKMLALESKLYVFGGNHHSECFAEVCDIWKNCWEALPCAEFVRIPSEHLIVAPFGYSPRKIILLNKMTMKMYLYDPNTQAWSLFNSDSVFQDHFSEMHGQPCLLEGMSTLYWIDGRANICAYDWEENKFFHGPIAGLSRVFYSKYFASSVSTLMHLVDEFFCVAWNDYLFPAVHLSIIRVCKGHLVKSSSVNHLKAVMVDCLRYGLETTIDIGSAYVI